MATTDMAIRDALVAEARRYLGTPFRHQGRAPGTGLDCVGVVLCAGRAAGLCDYDFAAYGPGPAGDLLIRHALAAGFRPLDPARARPGDVAAIRFRRAAQHVALITGIGLLHCHAGAGRVVEHGLDDAWRSRIAAVFAFPGL